VDVAEARNLPGVLDVVTAADLEIGPYPPADPAYPEAMVRPMLADGTVRFVGEPIAAIVTETPAQGEDAAAEVVVELDPLPAVVDVHQALDGEGLVFPP